jgi:predicted O-methyltransferase YrrM
MNFDQYLDQVFVHEDDILKMVKAGIVERGMPAIFVPTVTGAALNWLIQVSGSRDVLEIGALGGYSGIWLARALPAGGTLTSLELRPDYRDVALANLTRAGFKDRVAYRVGPAAESLAQLEDEGRTFDFFFIDADKDNYPIYLDYAVRLARPGAIITADNTLQGGRVLDPEITSPAVEAIRAFNQHAADHPRLQSLILPIGDGLTVARVVS